MAVGIISGANLYFCICSLYSEYGTKHFLGNDDW